LPFGLINKKTERRRGEKKREDQEMLDEVVKGELPWLRKKTRWRERVLPRGSIFTKWGR